MTNERRSTEAFAGEVSAPLTHAVEAYCVSCKTKRTMQDGRAIFMANGRPAARGICSECGTNLFRIGETPDHAGLPKPDPQPSVPRQKKSGKGKNSKSQSSSKSQGSTGNRNGQMLRNGSLVIVESPAKAKTIEGYLGRGYYVRASVGHVRDLLRSRLSVDIDQDFAPTYRVPNEKRDVIRKLKAEAERAEAVYLATDPDREGEAIAWHVQEALGLNPEQVRRVVFQEITSNAVRKAFAHPRKVDMQLVNAQQARRIMDRLVGYKISPLLWDRVRSRTSAGRVQSVALRLIVEREREIEGFVSEEYWSIEAELAKQEPKDPPRISFIAKLFRIRGQEVDLKNRDDAYKIVEDLEGAEYQVTDVRRGERRRNPASPFTTSTLQQEASRRLGFTARRTMSTAQQLYEGISLGPEGNVGLITYMRTDSVNVAADAQKEARGFITETYGQQYLPPQPPRYKSRARNAQEAHEAIRPTSVLRTPDKVRRFLSRDQHRLYELIWVRFVASQMAAAILDTISVDVEAGKPGQERPYLFRATGSQIKFPGFLVVYEESLDEDATPENDRWLPDLGTGEWLDLLALLPEQHFTQPPPRYTEATLVRALEENGIGRPSTYAPILSTIQSRGYVERVEKRLHPTELGFVVCDLLVKHFPNVFEVGFTARMEEALDAIADGDEEWVDVLRNFWDPFSQMVKVAQREMEHQSVADQDAGELCDKCGSPMVIKFGRFGKFIACSNYPECKNTKPYLVKLGVTCPECGGDVVERRTKKGRIFYGCSRYPDCQFSSWKRPLAAPCPRCAGLLVQAGKTRAQCTQCGEWFNLKDVEREEAAPGDSEATPVMTG